MREKKGAVLAISSDSWEDMLFREERLLAGLVLLADPERTIISEWGLEDMALGKEIARPAVYLIAPDGTVAWRHLPTDWRIRMGEDEFLAAFSQAEESG